MDFAGAVPTIRKAYLAPHTEDRLAWALFIAGNAFNLLAVDRWQFAIAIYPLYMFLASGTIAALVLRPPISDATHEDPSLTAGGRDRQKRRPVAVYMQPRTG